MNRRILDVSNLLEAVESGMILIVDVESKGKDCIGITQTDQVTPDQFMESIQYLNEAKLFRNGIDFYYEFTGKNSVHIDCAMKNIYLDEYFIVKCIIQDGFSANDIEAKFRKSFSDSDTEKSVA